MKIAVASEKEMVAEHFGFCEHFNIFETGDSQITSSESLPNPGHQPGLLPNLLGDMGVNVIISGGMGGNAINLFNEKDIEVVTGAKGVARDAAEQYLQGVLESTGSVCHQHLHHEECGTE